MTHDIVGIGIGPFNLGLACLTDPIEELDAVFLDRRDEFDWHPGMMLEHSTVQTPFMADLVTLADPTSRFSFLNYAKESGHLYSFYIRETFQPLRMEFNQYCRWAAERLDTLRWQRDVAAVEYDAEADEYVVHATTADGGREQYRARHVVLGTGTAPHVPECCDPLPGDAVHNSEYLFAKDALQDKGSITIVGGGQSAAEVFHQLLEEIDDHDYDLTWITRSERFFPLEYTKLTLEMTSPEYTEYFHELPPPVRDGLVASQAQLYKGIDSELIDEIFQLLYRKRRRGRSRARLLTNSELSTLDYDAEAGRYTMGLRHTEQEQPFELETEGLVLATGYRHQPPPFLSPMRDLIEWDGKGRFAVRRNYTIDRDGGRVFVQNAELHTHGFVAPDLGMAAYRNSQIIRELLGREVYAIEESIAFQEFGAPEEAVSAG